MNGGRSVGGTGVVAVDVSTAELDDFDGFGAGPPGTELEADVLMTMTGPEDTMITGSED